MKLPRLFLNFSLLKQNPHFRAVFIARMISVLALGIMLVAVPMQIHQMTGSTVQVGLVMALDGLGMFVGLLCGGVWADRYDRRRLILCARSLCGIGFIALAINSFIATPSLLALYLISLWDGFFGAMGISALMAATPALVGRENFAAAGALSMLVVRLGSVLAPALGGVVMASAGVSWNYLLAGLVTLCTLLPLTRLPVLLPQGGEPENPLLALRTGLQFLWQNKVVGAVVAAGTLQALLSAVRVLFPALAETSFAGGAMAVGLMYGAVPLGAMLAALSSGWVGNVARPGYLLLGAVLGSAMAIASLGWIKQLWPALLALLIFGYLGALAALLQFTLVQNQTPDHLLGRVNSLWNAQDVVGDALGVAGVGLLAGIVLPLSAAAWLGGAAGAVLLLLGCAATTLRRLGSQAQPDSETGLSAQ